MWTGRPEGGTDSQYQDILQTVTQSHSESRRQTDDSVATQTDRNRRETMTQAENGGARAAVWQRVCTAEHKLKKPRPLSHTPLGPKLHGALHSTHKQPAGNVRERQGEARLASTRQRLCFHISTMPAIYGEAAGTRGRDSDFTLKRRRRRSDENN